MYTAQGALEKPAAVVMQLKKTYLQLSRRLRKLYSEWVQVTMW
jgi:hypothetical protein